MNAFGTQIRYAYDTLQARLNPVNAGGSNKEIEIRINQARQITTLVMQVLGTFAIIAAASFFFTDTKDVKVQLACVGAMGAVVGYWFR
jgi:hypothetical protein